MYYEDFKAKAAAGKCEGYDRIISDLSKQLPKVSKRLEDEKSSLASLRNRLAKLGNLSVESLAGDANSYEKYKTSQRKLSRDIEISEEIIVNVEKKVLPDARLRLSDAKRNLNIVLSAMILETRPLADDRINELLRACLSEREAFLDAWRTIYSDYGQVLIVSDEARCPGPWSADKVIEMEKTLGIGDHVREPTHAEIWASNKAPRATKTREREKNSEPAKISVASSSD